MVVRDSPMRLAGCAAAAKNPDALFKLTYTLVQVLANTQLRCFTDKRLKWISRLIQTLVCLRSVFLIHQGLSKIFVSQPMASTPSTFLSHHRFTSQTSSRHSNIRYNRQIWTIGFVYWSQQSSSFLNFIPTKPKQTFCSRKIQQAPRFKLTHI